MRLIHCADLHLASKLESRLTPEQAKQRRNELFESFRRLADEAVRSEVQAVLICGDIFDEGRPRLSAKKRFIEIISNHPTVKFFCLAGNHDESLVKEENLPENLYCFGNEWTRYSLEDVDIWGVETDESNYSLIYSSFRPDTSRINIVMLHGQISEYTSKPTPGTIVLPLLADMGIDYLALGHIHSFRKKTLDSRGVWCYSGCLEGRGYDECGEKGYVLLEQTGTGLTSVFVPFCLRTVLDVECDIGGLEGFYEIEERVVQCVSNIRSENLVRMKLTGEVDTNAQIHIDALEKTLSKRFFHAEIKNAVKPKIRPEDYLDQLSLKGEFTRIVQAVENLSEEEKDQIIRCGFLAMQGEEVDEF